MGPSFWKYTGALQKQHIKNSEKQLYRETLPMEERLETYLFKDILKLWFSRIPQEAS